MRQIVVKAAVDGKRSRGRQWLSMRDVAKRDMVVTKVVEEDAMDRTSWRGRMRSATPSGE